MQFDSKYTGGQIEDILDGIQGGVVKPEDKNILDRIELGSITLNKGINDAVPIQKAEILNSKKNGEFFIVGASINGNSAYLYSYNDGSHIKCYRHYGQDVAIGGFVVMEISNINIEDGTARIDFKAETYPLQQSVLTKTNTTPFTPTGDYHPATKKYVDDKNVMYKIHFDTEPGIGNHLMINDPEGNDIEAERFKNILINNPYLNITFSPLLWSSEKTKCIGIDNYTMFFLSKDKMLYILNISNLSTQNQHMDYLLTAYDLVDRDSVLTKTNTTEYTPSQKYHPATKKYVDDLIGGDMVVMTAVDTAGPPNEYANVVEIHFQQGDLELFNKLISNKKYSHVIVNGATCFGELNDKLLVLMEDNISSIYHKDIDLYSGDTYLIWGSWSKPVIPLVKQE